MIRSVRFAFACVVVLGAVGAPYSLADEPESNRVQLWWKSVGGGLTLGRVSDGTDTVVGAAPTLVVRAEAYEETDSELVDLNFKLNVGAGPGLGENGAAAYLVPQGNVGLDVGWLKGSHDCQFLHGPGGAFEVSGSSAIGHFKNERILDGETDKARLRLRYGAGLICHQRDKAILFVPYASAGINMADGTLQGGATSSDLFAGIGARGLVRIEDMLFAGFDVTRELPYSDADAIHATRRTSLSLEALYHLNDRLQVGVQARHKFTDYQSKTEGASDPTLQATEMMVYAAKLAD